MCPDISSLVYHIIGERKEAMDEAKLQLLYDRMEISEVIIRFASALDMKEWELCRSCFSDEIEADYSDLRGEPAEIIKADDFVALRRSALSNLRTQHLSTNHIITIKGDFATCISHMVIHRSLLGTEKDNHFNTYGYYTHTLIRTSQGWKIKKIKQSVFWSEGNPQLHTGVKNRTTPN